MNMKKMTGIGAVRWLLFGFVAAALAACGGGGGGTGTAGDPAGTPAASTAGRVAILLTDAPVDGFDAVNVTITQVYLLADDRDPVLVFEDPAGVTRDLLELRDGAELLVDPAEVPPGCYDKIRLVVTRVELVRGDERHEARLPANGKIDLNPRAPLCVTPGQTLVLQLDMDAAASIHVVQTGQGGTQYNFRPVVFVTVLGGEDGALGRLVRLAGWVETVGDDRFVLCDTRVEPLARVDLPVRACVEVVPGEDAAVFDLDGTPVDPAAVPLDEVVFPDDYVRVVGRYALVVPPDPVPLHDEDDDDGDGHGEDDEAVCQGLEGRPCEEDGWMLRRFRADVVQVGTGPGSWGRYEGVIQEGGGLDDACVGTFAFRLDEGQGVTGDLDAVVRLQAGSRVYDREGVVLDCTALEPGARAVVDAVLFVSDTEADMLNAAVVVTRVEPETRIDGTLVAVADDGTLSVLPDGADDGEAVCVAPAPRVVPVLYTPAVGDEPAEFEEVALGAEHEGLPVTVFGEWPAGDGCFSAGAVIVTAAPQAEPET